MRRERPIVPPIAHRNGRPISVLQTHTFQADPGDIADPSLSPIESPETVERREEQQRRMEQRAWRRDHPEQWKTLPSSEDLKRANVPLLSPAAQLVGVADLLHRTQERMAAMLDALLELDRDRETLRLEGRTRDLLAEDQRLENSVLGNALHASITEVEQSLDSLTTLLLETWPALLECPKSNAGGNPTGCTKEAVARWLEQSLNATMLN